MTAGAPAGPLIIEQQREYGASYALLALARQLALDRLRRAKDIPAFRPAGVDLLAATITWLPRPDVVLQLEERMGLLKRIVNQLPKSQRAALEMAR